MEPMETSPPTSAQPTDPTPATVPSSSPTISSTPQILPPPSSSSSSSSTSLNPNPNNNSTQNPNQSAQTSTSLQQPSIPTIQQQLSQIRPQLNRLLPQSPFSQLPSHFPPSSSSSSSSSTSSASASASSSSSSSSSASSTATLTSPSLPSAAPPSVPATSTLRGGLAIGVPAHQARPPTPQPSTFSSFGPSSFGQQFGGLGRSSVSLPESIAANQNTSQARPPIQGIQTIGMMGSLSSGAQMRPSGVPLHQQQRAVQPSLRSQSPSSNQSPATQKFQSHGLLRGPSMTSPSSPSPGMSQGLQPPTQPWMSSAPQVKQMPPPSLPSPSYRQQMRPQSLQQRPNHLQQHHHSLQMVSHQQASSAQPQQQQLQTHHSQDHYGQQYAQPRTPISVPHQQQAMRISGPGNQKSLTPVTTNHSVQSGGPTTVVSVDDEESGNHILTKRSIRELVSQISPFEKLDPEVEDFLILVAEDFVDSITTHGCSLAKHRKSTTLEAKDILLHLERNWNMALPGFGGEEIKNYKKPITNDVHKERLVSIRKSMQGSDAVNTKNTGGQAAGNAKGHSAKMPSTGQIA